MIKNHLKIAWRNLVRNLQFSLINISGLSTGLACVLLIYLWVTDERNVDAFHTQRDRLYQVMGHISLPDGIHTQDNTPGMLAKSLQTDIPQIEKASSVKDGGESMIITNDKKIKSKILFADKNFFSLFTFPVIEGRPENLSEANHNIFLSHELAVKLFGRSDSYIGKTIQWGDETQRYTVSGIFEKPGVNSTMQFDVLLNYDLFLERSGADMLSWQNSSPSTYILLKKNADPVLLNKNISGFLQVKDSKAPLSLSIRKYADRYLYGKYENGVQTGGRIEYVRLFSIVAVFILMIACINFMNLSTAKAARRTKEIGIKKVAGASRGLLIAQYLTESLLMAFISMIIALLIVILLLPAFNNITGKQIIYPLNYTFTTALLLITLITGVLAGSYPALYLSAFKPVKVLKGTLQTSPGELWVRKSLVVFQFAISVIFIVSVFTVYRQMKLIQTINLGYVKDNIISIRNEGGISKSFEPFMTDIKKVTGVTGVSAFYGDMTGNTSGSTEKIDWPGKKPSGNIHISVIDVDANWLTLLGICLTDGRNFFAETGNNQKSIILNQAAIEAMGMKDAVGKTINFWGDNYEVIGITENFHFESLYEKVKPCAIRLSNGGSNILVKLTPANLSNNLASIGEIYKRYNPGVTFEYSFLDQEYQRLYVSEQRVAELSRWFAGLTIIISCLGLFGLASFTAEKRRKEIGIRKVIGASAGNILALLSADFMKLVALALIIAFPLAWWLMNEWLNEFAYRVEVSTVVFLITAVVVVVITGLTVCFQSVRAALMNPVKSLRLNE